MQTNNIETLIKQLVMLPHEMAWVEFKENNADPQMIGESISALANAAAYHEKNKAYLIWGIRDADHAIIGTSFSFTGCKVGNQPLENWLRTQLSENTDFNCDSAEIDGKTVVMLTVTKAIERTVMFRKTEYIRAGSTTKKLNDVINMKAQLWDRLRSTRFEELPALENLDEQACIQLLDFSMYFSLLNERIPSSQEGIVHYFIEDQMIIRQDDGRYTITNLGAILFARKLASFPSISRKAMRVVQYRGESRLEILRESQFTAGYAVEYENLIKHVEDLLPASEVIEDGIRRTELMLPSIAIRETLANALIHQDFSARGTGVLIEIFSNRMEITNPGIPLVEVTRIVDNPPRSRNEKIAALMRRCHICEESGTGWDKIIISSELMHLPAPAITVYEDNMRVTLRAAVPFGDLPQTDKLWACYMHACIRYVEGKQMNNTSLRERFGLDDSYQSQISRLLKAAVNAKYIKAHDELTAPRYMRYIPIWG